jgi:tetratricopeptide (TPR) repeat protein
MAMELVNGRSLDKIIPEKTLCVNDCLVLMKSVAETIGALHEAGYVHRDLKPGNILIDEFGSPKVADFGLVKSLDEITRLTASGLVCGTPAYMAPEQARGDGKAIDPRSDVWALGAVLYEMLAARPPFQAENALRLMLKITKNQPAPLRSLNLKVPRDVNEIVMRCLEKTAERRYATGRALAMDIARFLNGEPLEQGTQPKVQQFVNAAMRNRRPLAALACAIGAIVFVVAAARYFLTPKDPRALVAQGEKVLMTVTRPATPALERFTSAERFFREAASLDSKNARAQLFLGNCLGHEALLAKTFDSAKFEQAGSALKKAVELDPQLSADYHAVSADFNRLMQRYDLAAVQWEEALKCSPNNLKYRYELAMAYWWTGNQLRSAEYYSKALAECQRILAQDREYPHVHEYIKMLQELALNQSVARR